MAVASREDSGGGLDHPAMNIFPQVGLVLHFQFFTIIAHVIRVDYTHLNHFDFC